MRLIVFSASTGVLHLYKDYDREDDDGGLDEGTAFAARLFHINKLLLQASRGFFENCDSENDTSVTGDGAAVGAAAPGPATRLGAPGARSGGSGSFATAGREGDFGAATTLLGAGVRRAGRQLRAPAAMSGVRGSRLAVRQWHLDGEQWHLTEDVGVDVLLALGLPADWDTGVAAHLARAFRDAFVHAHRPQILALAAAATNSAAAPPPPPAFRPSPGGATPLLTLQSLKAVSRLAQGAMDALVAAGLAPCWLFVAHVGSFMGAQLAHNRRDGGGGGDGGGGSAAGSAAARGGSAGARGDAGASSDSAKRKRARGLLRSVLSVLRKGTKGGRGSGSSGGGSGDGGGIVSGGARAAEGVSEGEREPGPVGHLQHLVLPLEEEEAAADPRVNGAPGAGPRWEPASIAAALWQVRPTPSGESLQASRPGGAGGRGGGGGDDAAPAREADLEGGLESFPELDDEELTMEAQLGGAHRPPRRFTVAAVRLRHVVAVVAQQLGAAEAGAPRAEPTGDGEAKERPRAAGSISLVRSLLRPSLVPLSSLFHYLARWAAQEEIAAHGLLLRLLE